MSDTFQVTLHDLAGNTLTIPCTPHTSLVNLIEDFREVSPDINKTQRIILLKKDQSQLKRGTLGDNGIRSATTLFVVYTENIACADPEPITPYVYEWIEMGAIDFDEPILPSLKTYHANTDLLAEYNEWIMGQAYRFFLTHASPRAQRSFPSDRFEPNGIVHYQPLVGPDSPLHITLYPEGIPSDSHETMGLAPFSSVKGTLHSIKLRVTIKPARDDYECKYLFNVFLKGPIEIRDDRSTIIRSLGEEALCMMKYDQIVKCDEYGGPMIPKVANAVNEVANEVATNAAANRSQGGRRSRRSKRSKRSKRSQKTRRTKRRI
jgi:hypothetical protein